MSEETPGVPRCIELGNQILIVAWIARLYWDDKILYVVIPGETDVALEGEDARIVWKMFSEKDWRDD